MVEQEQRSQNLVHRFLKGTLIQWGENNSFISTGHMKTVEVL